MHEDALQEIQDAFKKELRRAKRKAMWEMQRQDRVDAALARKAREERIAEARREHGRALLQAEIRLFKLKNGMVDVREYEPADKDGWVLSESGAWVECEEVVRGRRQKAVSDVKGSVGGTVSSLASPSSSWRTS